MKRVFAFLLVIALLVATVPAFANAKEETVPVEITTMVLRPSVAGVYYRCQYTGSTENLAVWGVALSVYEMPNAENMEELCQYTVFYPEDTGVMNSALLTGILKEENSDATNGDHLNTVIYARPYVLTKQNALIFGEGLTHTFGQLVNKVDEKFEELEPAQQVAMMEMVQTYSEVITPETIPNMDKAQQEGWTPPYIPEPDPPVNPDPEPPVTPTGKTITIGVPANAFVGNYNENDLTQWLEAETGCEIEFYHFSSSAPTDLRSELNVLIAMGSLPDIIYGVDLTDSYIQRFGEEGYFEDLTQYYNDTTGASKHFWTALDSELTAAQKASVEKKLYSADGKMYTIPTVTPSALDPLEYQVWINQAWLDTLNLQMPTNISELYEVLVAFKSGDPNGNGVSDEIPLIGTENAWGGHVVEWLINMYMYYNSTQPVQPDRNGQLQLAYTQDSYQMALAFVNKLYKEKLLNGASMTLSASDIKYLWSTCGVVVANAATSVNANDASVKNFVAMPLWGYSVQSDITVKKNVFISADCENVEDAFKMMMLLYSEEGYMLSRYGKQGENWTKADQGAVSFCGQDAAYKILSDPRTATGQTSNWGVYAGSFDYTWREEYCQDMRNVNDVQIHVRNMLKQQIQNHRQAAAYTPKNVCTSLTLDSNSDAYFYWMNIKSYADRSRTEFITGSMDPNNMSAWSSYTSAIYSYGLPVCMEEFQKIYDNQ